MTPACPAYRLRVVTQGLQFCDTRRPIACKKRRSRQKALHADSPPWLFAPLFSTDSESVEPSFRDFPQNRVRTRLHGDVGHSEDVDGALSHWRSRFLSFLFRV